ncbi:RelA/SpoT domain-containing protein [Rheinheimera sp.]|uniref:RelA/SpoT domain-containing protein n=1 Tax=Rheinheimera sp. TaxID=1869214 RepID=UPI00307E7FC3
MANQQYEKLKYVMTYSKGQVSKAGRALRKGVQGAERSEAIKIIQDFRASHSYPLMIIKNHIWKNSKRVAPDVIIARRLKRLPTIINKLERPTLDGFTPNATEITRMQDIGGCRAIFKNLDQVDTLVRTLKKSRSVHGITKVDDYNTSPKQSGYRGIHLVYNCYQNAKRPSDWKGHRVEVQIRTRIQHAWSTAVELIDLFEKTDLKTAMEGHEEWRRFFFCLSYVLSVLDGTPHDVESVEKIRTELSALESKLNFIQKLIGYTMAQDSLVDLNEKDGLYLIAIYIRDDHYQVNVTHYSNDLKETAIIQYNYLELDSDVYQTVLVGAQGAGTLVQAYPNFFADSTMIVKLLKEILDKPMVNIPTREIRAKLAAQE